jgi:hypothetical protein
MTLGAWSQVDDDHKGNVVRDHGGRPVKPAQRMKATGRRPDRDDSGSDGRLGRVVVIVHGTPLEPQFSA